MGRRPHCIYKRSNHLHIVYWCPVFLAPVYATVLTLKVTQNMTRKHEICLFGEEISDL